MARLFDDASTEYLVVNQVFATPPFVIACRFRTDLDSTNYLLTIADSASNNDNFALYLAGVSAGDPIGVSAKGSGVTKTALSSAGYSLNTWGHATGIFVANNDRRAFFEGANKGTNADTTTPINLDRTTIGVLGRAALTGYMSGMIAEAAIWDLSVWPGASDSDKADNFEKILPSLAKGFTPLHFPLGLKAYWPLIRGLNDSFGGYNLTANGTVVIAHPRIIQPCGIL